MCSYCGCGNPGQPHGGEAKSGKGIPDQKLVQIKKKAPKKKRG